MALCTLNEYVLKRDKNQGLIAEYMNIHIEQATACENLENKKRCTYEEVFMAVLTGIKRLMELLPRK